MLTPGVRGGEVWPCRDCPIEIRDSGPGSEDQAASPYPSHIFLGVYDPGPPHIDKVTVTLHGLTHEALEDVDVLLVLDPPFKPRRVVELMSDVGLRLPVTNLDLTFDDDAPTRLPQAVTPVNGTYKPSNYSGLLPLCASDVLSTGPNGDRFPTPAPQPPSGGYGETLASVHGELYDHQWRLYVGDDCTGGSGSLASWSVDVTFIDCSGFCLVKQADSVTATVHSTIGFTLTASNESDPWWGGKEIFWVRLHDPLPGEPGLDWSISPPNPSCAITGPVGHETLDCSFGALSFGDTAAVHISSPTTGCGVVSNTASGSAENTGPVQDTASITVTGCPTAAQLASFGATRTKRGVLLHWRTASEAALLGFDVFRDRAGKLTKVNRAPIPASFAGSTHRHSYSILDAKTAGPVRYRLRGTRLDGAQAWLGSTVLP